MKATIFGAGNIGRGLVGVVLSERYDLTFVDADATLIEALSAAGTYDVLDTAGKRTSIAGATYVLASDTDAVIEAVAQSDIIATAVGAPILKIVAKPIHDGLAGSSVTHVNVLACENVHPNSPLLRQYVEELGADAATKAGFPEVVVDRIVSSEPGSIDLVVEPVYEFIADGQEWVGPHPPAELQVVDAIGAYEKRKLWLVNGLHASAAYLGAAAGKEFIHDAIADPDVSARVSQLADAMVAALEKQYPQFPEGAFAETARQSLVRFASPELADPVRRVARNPVQKLGANERIVGPAIAAGTMGVDTEPFAAVIASALSLIDSEVPGWNELQSVVGDWKSWLGDQGVPASLIDEIEQHMVDKGETNHMVTENIVIANPSGLHARPASQIVEQAKGFTASIEIVKGEKRANAGSIMSVLALGASTGDEVTVTAEGEDAEAALAFVREILTSTEGE